MPTPTRTERTPGTPPTYPFQAHIQLSKNKKRRPGPASANALPVRLQTRAIPARSREALAEPRRDARASVVAASGYVGPSPARSTPFRDFVIVQPAASPGTTRRTAGSHPQAASRGANPRQRADRLDRGTGLRHIRRRPRRLAHHGRAAERLLQQRDQRRSPPPLGGCRCSAAAPARRRRPPADGPGSPPRRPRCRRCR